MIDLGPGQRIAVRQMIDRREGAWSSETVGEVVSVQQEKTGSWFAHGKDDKLWLMRIRLRKDDGELTSLAVDQFTDVRVLSDMGDRTATR